MAVIEDEVRALALVDTVRNNSAGTQQRGMNMNKLTFSLLAGAASLFVSGAQAAPLTNGISQVDNGLLRVQMVCDQHGNCREEHHDRPVVILQDPHHEPRREHYEDPHHDRPAVVIQQDHHDEPRREHYEERPQQHGQPGIGIQVPGVSIGVGGDNHERR